MLNELTTTHCLSVGVAWAEFVMIIIYRKEGFVGNAYSPSSSMMTTSAWLTSNRTGSALESVTTNDSFSSDSKSSTIVISVHSSRSPDENVISTAVEL